jgi:hypothetical protein
MTMTSTISSTHDLRLLEVKPGLKFSVSTLKAMLPDAETVFFFGKVYDLDHVQLSQLLYTVLGGDLATALSEGDHSTTLQGYLDDLVDDIYGVEEGDITYDPDVPTGEILPEVWKSLEVETGEMHFRSMMTLNAKRPTIGDYRARIHHSRQQQNLLILDVSGSMTSGTVRTIVNDVVALAYEANAHLAIVSDTVTHWEPGNYDAESVLSKAEFNGTHYEQLAPLMDLDWGVVITVADYDSYVDARAALARRTGSIDLVLDVSLVNRPTFLAECVGTRAKEVRPILVAPGPYVLSN